MLLPLMLVRLHAGGSLGLQHEGQVGVGQVWSSTGTLPRSLSSLVAALQTWKWTRQGLRRTWLWQLGQKDGKRFWFRSRWASLSPHLCRSSYTCVSPPYTPLSHILASRAAVSHGTTGTRCRSPTWNIQSPLSGFTLCIPVASAVAHIHQTLFSFSFVEIQAANSSLPEQY